MMLAFCEFIPLFHARDLITVIICGFHETAPVRHDPFTHNAVTVQRATHLLRSESMKLSFSKCGGPTCLFPH